MGCLLWGSGTCHGVGRLLLQGHACHGKCSPCHREALAMASRALAKRVLAIWKQGACFQRGRHGQWGASQCGWASSVESCVVLLLLSCMGCCLRLLCVKLHVLGNKIPYPGSWKSRSTSHDNEAEQFQHFISHHRTDNFLAQRGQTDF